MFLNMIIPNIQSGGIEFHQVKPTPFKDNAPNNTTQNQIDANIADHDQNLHICSSAWIHLCNPLRSLTDMGYVLMMGSPIVTGHNDMIFPGPTLIFKCQVNAHILIQVKI